jgi:hypothetical protein
VAGLEHRNDTLGLLGVGQLGQLSIAQLHQLDPGLLQRRLERSPAGCTFESRGHRCATTSDPGAESFLHQPNPLGQHEAAALAAPAQSEVPDEGL